MSKKQTRYSIEYNPPMYVWKIPNFQKAIYERRGHWTEKEKIKYAVFIQVFRDKFEDKENPVLNRMFRVMSDFIKTRNHNQCRSHHQKMEKERFRISSILQDIMSKYPPRQYEILAKRYKEHLRTIDVDMVMKEKGYTSHKSLLRRSKKSVGQSGQQKSIEYIQGQLYDQGESVYEPPKIKASARKEIIKIQDSPVLRNKNKQTQKVQTVEQKKKQTQKEGQRPRVDINDTFNKDTTKQKNQDKTGDAYQSQDQGEKLQIASIQFPTQLINKQQNLQKVPQKGPINKAFDKTEEMDYYKFQRQIQPINKNPEQLNYYMQMKSYEEEKKWHLQEAHKAYQKMNEHLQQATQCETNIKMLSKFYMPSIAKHGYPSFPF